jgi:hypothetical protein
MTPEDLSDVIAEVRRLRARFAGTAPRAWEPVTAAAELAVQLGHLALCLLQRVGEDASELTDQARPIISVGDELADVLLAALSVAALAGKQPSLVPARPPGRQRTELSEFLRLVAAAGQLSEAAMIACGCRHQPRGDPPSIQAGTSMVVASCEGLAAEVGLDLRAEFRGMVAGADAFLDSQAGRQ